MRVAGLHVEKFDSLSSPRCGCQWRRCQCGKSMASHEGHFLGRESGLK